MNTNVIRTGDLVSFLYITEGVTKARLVFVEEERYDKFGGHDYSVGGYRNFLISKVEDPILLGNVPSKNDVEVEQKTVSELLEKYLGVVPVNNNVRAIHKYIRDSFVDVWQDANNHSGCIIHNTGEAYIVKLKSKYRKQLDYDKLDSALKKLEEILYA